MVKPNEELVSLLKKSHTITLLIHQNPDGDAIGSALAIKEIFQKNKKINLVCTDPIPRVFQPFLRHQFTTQLPKKQDLIVLLDCNELHRTGYHQELINLAKRTPLVIIDHHNDGDAKKISRYFYKNVNASSTAEILFDLFRDLRVAVSPETAQNLLLGIYCDTGGFQHDNTTSKTFRVVSHLIRYGANLNVISSNFAFQLTPAKKRLWSHVIPTLTITKLGLAVAIIKKEDLKNAGATYDDTYGLVNTLALIHEAKAALVLIETEKGWKGTLRTRFSSINVARLAKLFGGKGQPKAAGFITTKESFSGKIK